jgi:hypothetical protein
MEAAGMPKTIISVTKRHIFFIINPPNIFIIHRYDYIMLYGRMTSKVNVLIGVNMWNSNNFGNLPHNFVIIVMNFFDLQVKRHKG